MIKLLFSVLKYDQKFFHKKNLSNWVFILKLDCPKKDFKRQPRCRAKWHKLVYLFLPRVSYWRHSLEVYISYMQFIVFKICYLMNYHILCCWLIYVWVLLALMYSPGLQIPNSGLDTRIRALHLIFNQFNCLDLCQFLSFENTERIKGLIVNILKEIKVMFYIF